MRKALSLIQEAMKPNYFYILLFFFCTRLISCKAQTSSGYLKLEKEILLPHVKGRIDHLDINLKDQIVYMAALGNNTVEVLDLANGKWISSINGLDEPQGVAYIPQHDEIFVTNGGSGDCYFYNAKNLQKVATIHLPSDADDVHYNSAEKKIYVGYGKGGIAIIDADSHQQTGNIKLPAHPEGFQIDVSSNRLYVNLPDAHIIGVVNLTQMRLIDYWPNKNLASNFPMALDTVQQRVFTGYRKPSKLAVINARNGKLLQSISITGDADDLYYDYHLHRIYVSGGNGAIDIFQETENTFKPIGNIALPHGARTSLLIPQINVYVVAVRSGINKNAELLVYKTPE